MTDISHAVQSTSVDWLAWTILDTPPAILLQQAIDHSEDFLKWSFGEHFEKYFTNATWNRAHSRPPYADALSSTEGIAFYFGNVPHQHVELQGRACLALQRDEALMVIASGVRDTVTRLDVALDFDGDFTTSKQLAERVQSKRIKSRSSMVSSTGETHYIGSRKSERVVRCYEYYAPHERAGMPRMEFQLRKGAARMFIDYWLAYGKQYAAQMLLNSFNVKGIKVENHQEKLPTATVSRSNEKTKLWLIKTCGPAFKKLAAAGEIEDPMRFLERYFLPDNVQQSFVKPLPDDEQQLSQRAEQRRKLKQVNRGGENVD